MASSSEVARWRVSDVSEVPLRGFILRLRLQDGAPSVKDLKGGTLRVTAPTSFGRMHIARVVGIRDFAVSGGRASQAYVDRYGLVDVIVSAEDAVGGADGDSPIRIGWTATLDRNG